MNSRLASKNRAEFFRILGSRLHCRSPRMGGLDQRPRSRAAHVTDLRSVPTLTNGFGIAELGNDLVRYLRCPATTRNEPNLERVRRLANVEHSDVSSAAPDTL